MLTIPQIQNYHKLGYLHVPALVPSDTVESYKFGIKRLILARARSLGHVLDCDRDLDGIFQELIAINRSYGGDIYDHCRELPEFVQIMGSPKLHTLAKSLLNNDLVQIASSQCVFRIDLPLEDERAFDWHQDYWYNCLTPNAITVWIPLTDVSEELGPLQVLPESHNRLLPVALDDATNSRGNMARIFEFSPTFELDMSKAVSVPMQAGDALVFHSYLLHKSGSNRSLGRGRWTLQFRYADFENPAYASRAWKHGTHRGRVTFNEIHPDYVIR